MNQLKLTNKNIVISAAADGIGWCIAEFCLGEGANVFISDIDENKIALKKQHEKYNKNLFIHKVDTSNSSRVNDYFLELKKNLDSIHALINNVGIAGPTGKLEDLKIEEWCKTLDVNINSHFYFTKNAIPFLKINGGTIINLSSTAGIYGFPLRTPYAVSKWGVIGLTKSLAMELGEFNIRVNAVCPGSVSGERMQKVIEAKSKSIGISENKLQEDYEKMVSLKTFVDKKDIAKMIIFLISDDAKRISGQVIAVDGNTERMN